MRRPTPVIVGVGQLAEKDEDRIVDAASLTLAAVRRAEEDAGAPLAARADAVCNMPVSFLQRGGAAEDLAARVGARPRVLRDMPWSGSGVQQTLGEVCAAIAAGEIGVAIVAAGVADASVKRAQARGLEPAGMSSGLEHQAVKHVADEATAARPSRRPPVDRAAGIRSIGTNFAMVESVLMAEAGRTPAEQRELLGRVLAPFTAAAARRPDVAWFPQARTPAEISGVTAENRLIDEPYTKRMNSFPTVDQAGALLITTDEIADSLGIAADRRVYPWAITSAHEPHPPSDRPGLGHPPTLAAVVDRVLAGAGVTTDAIDLFDLYSCFPSSVQMMAAAFGLDLLDPRGLSVTGGLPYFGGAGAAYSALAIASMVEECRARPSARGAVVSIGGLIDGFAAGVYSTEPPAGYHHDGCADVEDAVRPTGLVVDVTAEGRATVDAMTVVHDRALGPVNAPIYASFPDGRRTGARPADPSLPAALSGTSLVGATVGIRLRDGQPVYEVV